MCFRSAECDSSGCSSPSPPSSPPPPRAPSVEDEDADEASGASSKAPTTKASDPPINCEKNVAQYKRSHAATSEKQTLTLTIDPGHAAIFEMPDNDRFVARREGAKTSLSSPYGKFAIGNDTREQLKYKLEIGSGAAAWTSRCAELTSAEEMPRAYGDNHGRVFCRAGEYTSSPMGDVCTCPAKYPDLNGGTRIGDVCPGG